MMAYTYLIGWSVLNKWYYGVRYAKGCHPEDLWVDYFTSSRHVQKVRSEFGEPDVVAVRRVFGDEVSARIWEDKVLRRLAAPSSPKWLNRHHGGKFFGSYPKTPETRKKMSEARKALGIVMTASTKAKISAAALARPFRAMGPMSEETKAKISAANAGKPRAPRGPMSEETKAKISAANAGKPRAPHSEETRRKISESQRGRPGRFGDDNPSRNPDVAAKISKTLTGRIRTEAEREAIRNGCVGRVMPKRGPMSEETKAKIRDGHLRSKQPKG